MQSLRKAPMFLKSSWKKELFFSQIIQMGRIVFYKISRELGCNDTRRKEGDRGE